MAEQLDLAEALRDINEGMANTAAAASPDWWKRAERAVLWIARERAHLKDPSFQAYDVVERFGLDEPDNTAKQWGALFAALRRDGLIEPAGYDQSRRPTASKSAVRTWKGTDRLRGEAAA